MTRPRKPRAAKPAPWQPPPRKRNKNCGSKRLFWPKSLAELNAWRDKRAADYAAANPEQLDLFRHTLAALNAAEAQPPEALRPKPPRRRPQRQGAATAPEA